MDTPGRSPLGSIEASLVRAPAAAIVACLVAVALLLAVAAPVRGDCAVGDEGCVQLEQTSGAPGSKVSLSGYGGAGCADAPASVAFVAGDYDTGASYPTARLDVTVEGETTLATFVVPRIAPGEYRLHLECEADIAYGTSPFLPGTFTVLATPGTDTAPSDPRPVLVLAAAVAFLVTLARRRRPARRG